MIVDDDEENIDKNVVVHSTSKKLKNNDGETTESKKVEIIAKNTVQK